MSIPNSPGMPPTQHSPKSPALLHQNGNSRMSPNSPSNFKNILNSSVPPSHRSASSGPYSGPAAAATSPNQNGTQAPSTGFPSPVNQLSTSNSPASLSKPASLIAGDRATHSEYFHSPSKLPGGGVLHPSPTKSREVIEIDSDNEPPRPVSPPRNASMTAKPRGKQQHTPGLSMFRSTAFDPVRNTTSAPPPPSSASNSKPTSSVHSLINPPPKTTANASRPSLPSATAPSNKPSPPAPTASAGISAAKTASSSSVYRKDVSSAQMPALLAGEGASHKPTPKSKANTAPSSNAPSPKPGPGRPPGSKNKPREELSTNGNGILSSGMLGIGGGAFDKSNDDDAELPTIFLNVPLNGETNKYINFKQLAEDQYGWAALNPALAKAKLRMSLGGVRSGDEIALDDGDSESESNMDDSGKMTGILGNGEGGAESGTNSAAGGRKKRQRRDVYDKADPFIDDSELLWEEQAAASKDGFFVYSGPLVAEGEKPQIERYRPDGTVKRGRGGRPRGSGTGPRGGRGGVSNRGTGATARKPRITKKEKEALEREKVEREKAAQQLSMQFPAN